MLRGVLLLLAFATGAAAQPRAAPRCLDRQRAAALERAAMHEFQAKALPSIAVALVNRNGLCWYRGWGFADARHRKPVDPDTRYRIGSITKLFTDLAVMQLVERGRIGLDEPVRTYLPGFAPLNPFKVPITVRDLMAHRGGMVREPPLGSYFDSSGTSEARAVQSLNSTALVARPGTLTKYSNAGVAVLGEIVAAASGSTYRQFVESEILQKLGMASSGLTASPGGPPLARAEDGSFDSERFEPPVFDLGIAAAGNLYSTPRDMSRFAQALLNRGRGIVSEKSFNEMTRRQFAQDSPPYYGLGFRIDSMSGHRMLWHSGGIYGYSSELRLVPDDGLGVLVFNTVDVGSSTARIADYALGLALAERTGTAPPGFVATVPVDAGRRRSLEGRYGSGPATVELRDIGGKLLFEGPNVAAEVRRFEGRYLLDDERTFSDQFSIERNGGAVVWQGRRYARSSATRALSPKPGPELASLIGDYGWEYSGIRVFERGGKPYVRIELIEYSPLSRLAQDLYAFPADHSLYARETIRFERDAGGAVTGASINGLAFPRRDFGAEAQARLRSLLGRARADGGAGSQSSVPPRGGDAPEQLVAIDQIDPAIRLDIKYATADNFVGRPVYSKPAAFLQLPAAQALAQVNADLRTKGYGLIVFDAYRPWFVTKFFWDSTPAEGKIFVADPAQGSRHNRGAAVDLTMVDLATGKPVEMPGRYDEMSSRSYAAYVGGTSRQRELRDLLRSSMEAHGFAVYPQEWWHFDYRGWERYPILNLPFEAIEATRRRPPALRPSVQGRSR